MNLVTRLSVGLAVAAFAFLPRAVEAGGPGILVARLSVLGYETAPDGAPDPSSELFTVGNRFFLIGHVVEFGPDLEGVVDAAANEYTVVLSGAAFVERVLIPPFVVGGLDDQFRFRIYEDSRASGTVATLAPGSPTASIPPSFVDGVEILTGVVANARVFWSTISETGNFFGGPLDYDAGSWLAWVPEGPNIYHDSLGEISSRAAPPGYPLSSTIELRYNAGLPARTATWGEVKSLYRGR